MVVAGNSTTNKMVAPLCSESQARPAKVTRECSTNTRKIQGASGSATATTQAAGAERLRRGQLRQCAPRLTSVRRGAVLPSSHFGGQPPDEFFDSGGHKGIPSERYFYALLTGEKIPRKMFSQRA